MTVTVEEILDKAVSEVVFSLERSARPVSSTEDISHIASISANNDKSIGAIKKSGFKFIKKLKKY